MIKSLKIAVSLIILLCMFLPLSQCSTKTGEGVNEDTGEVVRPSRVVETNLVISNLIFDKEVETTVEGLIFLMLFFIPISLSLMPGFSAWRKVVKLMMQTSFSLWFAYYSWTMVFAFGRPLFAGYLLMVAAGLFVVLCFLELIQIRFKKRQNNASSSI